MRIFLDVGAHEGQTLDEVLDPAHGFDWVYAFEPMPKQYQHLVEHYRSARLHVFPYGLAAFTGPATLYGTNRAMEASMHREKSDVDATVATAAEFVRASEWFKEWILDSDHVTVKLNCEGAETQIVNDLIDSGEVWKVDDLMIDFDVRKIPGREHEEAELVARLAGIGFDRFVLCEDVMVGETHQERIRAWLTR